MDKYIPTQTKSPLRPGNKLKISKEQCSSFAVKFKRCQLVIFCLVCWLSCECFDCFFCFGGEVFNMAKRLTKL